MKNPANGGQNIAHASKSPGVDVRRSRGRRRRDVRRRGGRTARHRAGQSLSDGRGLGEDAGRAGRGEPRARSTSRRTAGPSGSGRGAARTPAPARACPRSSASTRPASLTRASAAGMFVFPHGFHVDRDGNVWVTDARGRDGKGHQVFKFSPDGKVLLTLGKAGVAGDGPGRLQSALRRGGRRQRRHLRRGRPRRGLQRAHREVLEGREVHQDLGQAGDRALASSTRRTALAFDSRGRLFVADRGNNRIQIFDQDGQVPRGVEAVRPAERDLHRQERRPLRRRLGVEHASATPAGSAASASAAPRTARSRPSFPTRSRIRRRSATSGAEGVAADAQREHLRRGSRPAGAEEVREEVEPLLPRGARARARPAPASTGPRPLYTNFCRRFPS